MPYIRRDGTRLRVGVESACGDRYETLRSDSSLASVAARMAFCTSASVSVDFGWKAGGLSTSSLGCT